MKAIHYSGQVRTPRTKILAGWAACCSGAKAEQIKAIARLQKKDIA